MTRAAVITRVIKPALYFAALLPLAWLLFALFTGRVMGDQVKFLLLAGAEVSASTLLRFYVLHVLFFPFVIVIFMAVHFWRVRKDGGISGPL